MNKIKQFLQDRDERNLLTNIAMAFLVKGLSLLVSFFSMPMYIKYFGNDDVLGVWYTVLQLLSWINICDLGLGNGLRNRLTINLSQNDRAGAKQNISSTYILLCIVAVPVALIGSVLLSFVDWNTFFGIKTTLISPQTFRAFMLILFNGVILNFVLKIINSIIYAVQKSAWNNALTLIVSVLQLLFVMFYNGKDMATTFVALAIVHAIVINLPLLIATLILFSSKLLKDVKPSVRLFTFKKAKGVVGFGLRFFLAQLAFMLLMSTNEIMITRMFSSGEVVPYSIYYKLFTVVGSLFMLALTPIWSKVTSDLAKKKYGKILKTNKVLYLLSACAIVCEFIMVALLPFLFKIWLGAEAPTIDYTVAIIFALFGGIYILNVVLTTVANGIGELQSQIVVYGIGAVLKIPVCMLLKALFHHWSIVVVYNVAILIVFAVYQFFWVEKRLRTLQASEAPAETVEVAESVESVENIPVETDETTDNLNV